MTTLYQLDSTGLKLKTWTIETYPKDEFYEIKTTSQLGETGKISEDFSIVKVAKEGYANIKEQAEANVQSKINKKVKEGYKYSPAEAQPDYILGSGSYRPMLAMTIDPFEKIGGSKSVENWGILNKRIAIQPKLDGNRLLIHVKYFEGKIDINMFSREGEPMSFPHIFSEIWDIFNHKYQFEAEWWDFWLDGEIYNHKEDFDFINGTYRKFNDVDISKQERLEYHVYDCWMESIPGREAFFEERQSHLDYFFSKLKLSNKCIIKVPTVILNCTQEMLDTYLDIYVSQGYEGIMVRRLDMPYEFKRTKQLLKYKPERKEDAEFECVGVIESAYGDMVGSMVFKLPNGETFKGTPNVPQERCIEWWKNKDLIIGKMFTVIFQGYTQYGKPRFPKVKAERD